MGGAWTGEVAPAAAVAAVEALVSEVVLATDAALAGSPAPARAERVSDPVRAVRAAAERACEGKRAAALVGPRELLAVLDALASAALARAPVVIHVTGAAPALGRDELAPALDAGAAVVVSSTVQEAVDLTLAARRTVEDAQTPLLHICDVRGPAAATPPTADHVAHFLGSASGPARPTLAPVDAKRAERSFTSRVPFALASALRQLGEAAGRSLGPIDRTDCGDAEEMLVAYGCAVPAAREVCTAMRAEGRKVGLVAIRALRPFFSAECVKALSRVRAVVVLEPLDAALAPAGPVTTAIKVAFADALTWTPGFPGVGRIPPIVSAAFATLDRGIRPEDVRAALDELAATGDRARRSLVFGG